MATRKVDRIALYATDQASLVITSPTVSTTGKTLTAKIFAETAEFAGTTGTTVGTANGAGIGVNITVPLALSAVTANAWYALRVYADLGESGKMGVFPNQGTADVVLIYVLPMPS
jgi:hypothetical protein